MTDRTMTADRVLDLIEIYGREPGGWPEAERDGALALIAAQPERFAEALAQAAMLDGLLAREVLPEPSAALSARILDAAPRQAARRAGQPGSLWAAVRDAVFPQGARWPVGAALASLAMGTLGGYAYAQTLAAPYDEAEAAYLAAFGGDTGSDWLITEESAL